jgi:hypothetical protein
MISTAFQQDFDRVTHIFADLGKAAPRLFRDPNLIRPNRLFPPLEADLTGFQNIMIDQVPLHTQKSGRANATIKPVRSFAFGLKHEDVFQNTHLGRIGR